MEVVFYETIEHVMVEEFSSQIQWFTVTVSIKTCNFVGNMASDSGWAMPLENNKIIVIIDYNFKENIVLMYGDADPIE